MENFNLFNALFFRVINFVFMTTIPIWVDHWKGQRIFVYALQPNFFIGGLKMNENGLRKQEGQQIQSDFLQLKFNDLQSEMVDLGMTLGLSHPSVLALSQELDGVHNQMLGL